MVFDLKRLKILIELEAVNIFQQKGCRSNRTSMNKELFKNFYSLSIFQTAVLYVKLCQDKKKKRLFTIKRLLWTLSFLKQYNTGRSMSYMFDAKRDTITYWIWHGIYLISRINMVSISFIYMILFSIN